MGPCLGGARLSQIERARSASDPARRQGARSLKGSASRLRLTKLPARLLVETQPCHVPTISVAGDGDLDSQHSLFRLPLALTRHAHDDAASSG